MIPTKHDNIFDLYFNLNSYLRNKTIRVLSENLKMLTQDVENWILSKSTPKEHQDFLIKTLQNITALNNKTLWQN